MPNHKKIILTFKSKIHRLVFTRFDENEKIQNYNPNFLEISHQIY